MAADPLVGKVLADRFEILERIGEGGTGVVYKARQTTVDREVAIKVLGAHVSSDPQWVKRFQNEARAVAKLNHPNTVQLIDFGQTREGLLFIAMEFLHGRSLRDELDRSGKLAPNRALRIIIQACSSVGQAHELGIIHRDLKPDNMYLIDAKGAGDSVKVLDFSVAKMDTGEGQQTRAGIVFGTPAYMSPEQGRGAKLGPQSDIYAFGIVLYEMLTGKPPFDSKIPTEVVMMHLRDKPKPLVGFPEVLASLVMRTLDKDPARRQQTCEQLAAECEDVLAQMYPQLTPQGGIRQASSASGRHSQQPSGNTGPLQPVPGAGSGAHAAPPPPVQPSGGEARTMIAEAPQGFGAGAGGRAAPPPGGGYGAPPPGGAAQARGQAPQQAGATVMLDAPQGQALGRARPAGATMIADGGAPRPAGGVAGGTMVMPDSQGIIAFELAKAEQARQAAAFEAEEPPAPRTHWTFWAAWALLGAGAGLALHFLRLSS